MASRRFLFVLILSTILIVPVFGDVVPRDFWVEVGKGNVPGHSYAHVSGLNIAVGTIYEDVISVGGVYVFPSVAAQVNVSSTDVDDTNGGSGAWNVTIEGLNADWVAVSETILLNGQTNVTSILSFIRINNMYIRKSGASGSNEGTISAENTLYVSEIIPNHGENQYAIYSIPVNTTGFPITVLFTSSEDKVIEYEYELRLFGESWRTHDEFFSFRTNLLHDMMTHGMLPGKSDVKIKAKVGATTGEVGASFSILLVTDAVLNNASLNWADGSDGSVAISVAETLTTTNPESQLLLFVGLVVVIALGLGVVASRRRWF